jgi:serine/threonine protein kinase/Tol biopolymer transport system component
MDPNQVDIKSLFSEAIKKRTAAERAAYLDEICGNNHTLRAEFEELLKIHDEADDFLEAPPVDCDVTLDTDPLTEAPGTVIGRYKLLEQIGEGGMAVVYMAEQKQPLRRKLALKIIKLGMDTKQVIARFEAERQALAMMDHPNIAKVFDAGTTDTGRPYFVMELVHGISMTAFCDQQKLPMQKRLALFLDVCSAVQHAHQRGIIHRDLKPSNIMVTMHDDRAVPKVIDFGIAKATNQRLTEKTLFTRYAQMIGTPAYMSPEQAQMSGLDIDTRSDIYSLGVLLYELLTGTVPFSDEELHRAGFLEIQRIIREEEPVKPSTKLSTLGNTLTEVAKQRCCTPELLRRTIRGDLDWIVMKSLEKNRSRRYETASAFKRDIQHYLQHEPVEARQPGVIYRMCKYLYRYRVRASAVLAALVLMGAMLTMLFMAYVGQRERHDSILSQVRKSLTKGDREPARKQLKTILASRHVGSEARLLHASILVDDGDRKLATDALEDLFNEEPEITSTAHALMVRLLWETQTDNVTEDSEAIEQHTRQAEELRPNSAESCFLRALTALTIDEKRNWLGQALALDYEHYESRRLRALLNQASRKYEKLKEDSFVMTGLKPEDALGFSLLAIALENLNDDDAALAYCERAIGLTTLEDPQYIGRNIHCCEILQRLERYDQVIITARACLVRISESKKEGRTSLQFRIFAALTSQGKYKEASDLFERIASPNSRSNSALRVNWGFNRHWSVKHVYSSLEAGQTWHSSDRVPQGRAFRVMHEAEESYRELKDRAKPLLHGFAPSWSPDGTQIVFSLGVIGYSGIAVYDVESKETELLITPGQYAQWSPDGQHIVFERSRDALPLWQMLDAERIGRWAYGWSREIWIMKTDGTEPRYLCSGKAPTWSHDSQYVYYHSMLEIMLHRISIGDRQAEPEPLRNATNWNAQMCVSPDNQRVARVMLNSLEILDLNGDIPVHSWENLPLVTGGNWSPSSRQFSLGCRNGRFSRTGLWMFDLNTDQAARVLKAHINEASWAPDGTRIAITVGRPNFEIWLADLDPNVSVIESLGRGCTIESHHREGVAYYTRLSETEPEDPDSYLERAWCHYYLDDKENMLADMNRYVDSIRPSAASNPREQEIRNFLNRLWQGTPVNLGQPVNSRFEEHYVNVSGDGLALYFASTRPSGLGQGDLWVSTRDSREEPWGPPRNLGSTINTEHAETAPSISADQLTLYFSSDRPGGLGGRDNDSDIWVSKRQTINGPWGAPVNLGPPINTPGFEWVQSISADGLELYYGGNRKGGLGGSDVWVATRVTKEDLWGTPKNLGPAVNTDWTDGAPSLSPDGLMLFYHYCWGGKDCREYDVWFSTRATKSDPWAPPVNLGPTINTYGWDRSASMTADGSLLYYISDRDGTVGARDILELRIPFTVEMPTSNDNTTMTDELVEKRKEE